VGLFLWKTMTEKLLGYIAHTLLKYLSLTWRYEIHFKNDKDRKFYYNALEIKNTDMDKRFLLAFFHQDELSIIPYLPNNNISVLISQSRDGQIMTNNALYFGYVPVRGSSSRGAVGGFMAAYKKVKQGHKFAMAVDGPRGPIYKVKEGLPSISQRLEVPILPIRLYPKNFFLFKKAWNQAKLPFPFSKIIVNVGNIEIYDVSSLEAELTGL
jgi:lysophospholipid acyltransferase (LPLAT)-like uncharacterized protein